MKTASAYHDLAAAQATVDKTIAAPENQRKISAWISDGMKQSLPLTSPRSAEPIGVSITRSKAP